MCHARLSPLLRRLCLSLALCFVWSFAAAPLALAATASVPPPVHATFRVPTPAQAGNILRALARRRERQDQVRADMGAALARSDAALARGAARSRPRLPSVTLLNQDGRLGRPITTFQAGRWVHELRTTRLPVRRAATLHVWLGEWELADEQQPALARWHFAVARRLVPRADGLNGLAAYDAAVSLFVGGAYSDATDAFHGLLLPRSALPGYSRPLCALWWRHASACDAYHRDHARLGIPEPPRLDPLCGAAALAASLRALRLPYDRKTLLASCRVTGEGSSLADLVAAGPGLGVHVRSLTATDQGLRALPKPVVAYVEHDHFVSVIRADRAGVAYLCSDCGMWPGGEVDLTWRQWHALSPGLYAAVTRPGNRWDLALGALGPAGGVRLAYSPGAARSLTRPPHFAALLPSLPSLRGVHLGVIGDTYAACGGRYRTLQCLFFIKSPTLSKTPASGPQPQMASGPSGGDPVNLSTGEEEYEPDTDLTVYNPHGPSVTWGRTYASLDSSGNGQVEQDDFGCGWSQPYNVSVFHIPNQNNGYVWFSNGASVPFSNPTGSPTAGHPLTCPVATGVPLLVQYNYAAGGDYYSVTFRDRTTWVMSATVFQNWTYPLSQIVDRNGNSISFHLVSFYANSGGTPFQGISSITDSGGNTLLTVARNGSGQVTSVSDCYGRSVYYQEAAYSNYSEVGYELTGVSQVVPTGTANAVTADSRYVYGYTGLANPEGNTDYFLNSITVPSPTGTGTSMATIAYNSSNQLVTGLTDGNGNTAAITYPSGNTTQTTLSHTGGASYTSTVGYDSQMNQISRTDGAGHATSTVVSFSGADPYEPASTTDGNGRTWSYTWDAYGNMLTETPPTVAGERTADGTTNTYSTTNFALGELTATQTGSKTATSYAYYEPSGLVETVTGPQPGTAAAAAIVLAAYTYDGLGNTTAVTRPGPNSTPAATTAAPGFATYVTTTLGYTSDGSYSQADAIGEPLVVTDPLGHATHFRYAESVPYEPTAGTPINRGHAVSTVDALGNETDVTFNIDDRFVATVLPATGQSGNGHGSTDDVYLYDEAGDTSGQEQYGPLASVKTYDEGNTAGPIRQVNYAYGPEGETQGVSGSAEPVTYAYDALYRLSSLTDGGGHTTRYFYNTAGYLSQEAYPLSGATTAALAAGSADTVTDTSYDGGGDLTGCVDGNGTTTTYTYADPESLLTNVHYALPASPPAYISALADTGYTYDGYGRRQTMTDATGSQSYGYDDGDRMLSDVTTYTGLPARTISYGYDPDGSRAAMGTPAGGFSYTYDNAGRMTGLMNPYSEASSWSYLSNNWLWKQTLGNNVVTAHTYNALGETTDLQTKTSGGTVLSDFSAQAYNGAGSRTGLTASLPGAAAGYSGQTAYGYDYGQTGASARGQLTGEQSTRGGSFTLASAYDGGTSTGPGNPTTLRGSSHAFNADNQDTANTYDGDGNPTTYRGTAMKYDPEGRLTQVGTAETNTYTGDGLRAEKTVGSTSFYYLYDGDDPVVEMNTSGSAAQVHTFGADGLLSRRFGGATYYYTFDPSGNVAQRLNSVGVSSSDLYDGFGAVVAGGGGGDVFGFGGQWGCYTDAQTGLVLCTHRYYDPAAGRFITRDPIRYNGGVNLYGYARNNPVNLADPTGNNPFDAIIICMAFCKLMAPPTEFLECLAWCTAAESLDPLFVCYPHHKFPPAKPRRRAQQFGSMTTSYP